MIKHFHPNLRGRLICGINILVPFKVTPAVVLWLFDWLRRLIRPLTVGSAAILIHVPRADEMPRLAMKVIVSGPVVSVVDRLCNGRYRYLISQPAFLNSYCYVKQR